MRLPKPSASTDQRDQVDPAVSVVMPVYNGERFLSQAIDSVLAEELTDLELVIVDDGSTDSTPQILAEYAARDPRVRAHRESCETVAAVLNRGVAISRAPLVARLDADDLSVAGRLQRQVSFMNENPEVVLLGGWALLVDDENREFGTARYPLQDAELRKALATGNPFVHSAAMIRRSAFDQVGGYRENLFPAEDLDLWLRLAERGRLANLGEAVAKYRIHQNQVSLQKQENQAVHTAAALLSARARAEGRPDPVDGAQRIDAEFLVARGVKRAEITRAVVEAATWLGRTTGRAGYSDSAAKLFAMAYRHARSDSGSAALTASVHRSIAHRHAEQGHRLRAKLKAAQARLAERR